MPRGWPGLARWGAVWRPAGAASRPRVAARAALRSWRPARGEQFEPAEELTQAQVEESECHGRTSSRVFLVIVLAVALTALGLPPGPEPARARDR